MQPLYRVGHNVQFDIGGYGGYQAIVWDDENRVYCGASESRKGGQVLATNILLG